MRAALLATLLSFAIAQTCNEQNQINEFCDDICAPPTNPCDICATYIEPCDICSTATITCGEYCPEGQFANGTKCSDTCKENERMLPFTHQCQACPDGTTRLAGDSKPSTCCTVGYMQTGAGGECVELTCNFQGRPLLLENFTCGDICPEGTFANHSVCSPHTPCSADEFEIVEATASQDRTCQTIRPPCNFTAGQFQASAPTATSDRICQSIRTCTEQEFQISAPTNISDRSCQSIRTCTEQEFETSQPTATSDRTCQSLTTCTEQEFETSPPTATSDRSCQSLTTCSAEEFEASAPTATSDRSCQSLTTCTEQEFEASAPTANSDRSCQSITTCSAEEFEASAPTATSDRSCQSITTCTEQEFEVSAQTATSDRICQSITTCTEQEFETSQPTATSDRTCQSLTTCSAEEFETSQPTATSDRTCQSLTTCTEQEFETSQPTATSDRTCQSLTTCSADEFETSQPTATSDRSCQTLTSPCSEQEFEATAPTATSDRLCVCKEDHFFNGIQCQNCASGTRLQGDSKEESAQACCLEAFQSEVGAACTPYTLPTACNSNEELIGGNASEDKYCSACPPDKTSENGQPCQSFAEKQLQGSAIPTTENTIVTTFRLVSFSFSVKEKKKQMQSMVKFLKQQIRALAKSRIQMTRDELVLSDKFQSKLGNRVKIDVIAAKQKTVAKINSADACEEKDVDLRAQPLAYEVSLEEQEAALVCSGNTPVTKLTMTREGALYGEDTDLFQYACWNGLQWTSAVDTQSDAVYQCDEKNFYVNSLSGVTCNVSDPVSQADPTVTAGNAGTDCGETIGDGDTCSSQCNENFILVQQANCSTDGFETAICQCPAGHQDNLDGTCTPCAENSYATEPNTLSCTLHATQHCTAGEFFTQGNALEADSATCTPCPDGSYQPLLEHTENTCIAHSTIEEECNALRKTFLEGTSTQDTTCAQLCLPTEYANGTTCYAQTLQCPAGYELIQSNNNYTDNTCQACAENTYKELSDDSQCIPCSAGNEMFPLDTTSAATGCEPCNVTTEYDHDGVASTGCIETPEHCPAGFQHTLTLDPLLPNLCTYCQDGTYQPNNNSLQQCIAYSTTKEQCNALRKTFIEGSSKITDDAQCGNTCPNTHYASGELCIAYANTANTCNENNAKVQLGQANHTDDSLCIPCSADTETANGQLCTCAIDHFYNGTHCQQCLSGHRLEGDDKTTITECCIDAYQNQPQGQCIDYTDTTQCNANRQTVSEGDRNTDAACGNLCLETEYASAHLCIPYSTTAEQCNGRRKTFIEGNNNTDAACGNLCLETEYASADLCIPYSTTVEECNALRRPFIEGNNNTDAACHYECLLSQYAERQQCIAYSTTVEECNGLRRPFIEGNNTHDAQCANPCTQTEYASQDNCIAYSTTKEECNALRKTFIEGNNNTDAACGNLCLDTEYAEGDQCYELTLTCPAGFAILTSSNYYTDNQCVACQTGFYKELSDDSQCIQCPAGHEIFPINATLNATGCEPCNVTTEYDHDGNPQTGCIETPEHCPAGFQHTLTLDPLLPNLCTYCPDGTYQPNNQSLEQCIAYSTTKEQCNALRKTFIQGSSKTSDDAQCENTCLETEYASADLCSPYSTTKEECNAIRRPFIEGNNNTDAACADPCLDTEYAEGDQCFVMHNTACTVTKPVSAIDENIVAGINVNCPYTVELAERCEAQCNENYVKVQEGNCTIDGYQPAKCLCNITGFHEDGTGNCKSCDAGLFLNSNSTCIPWTVTAQECNALNKPFLAGDHQTDANCAETCAEGLKAEGNRCIDPLAKIHCDALSWLYDEGLCCENQNNAPSCVYTLDRQATVRLNSFGNLKRADGSACQDTDQITYQQGILICT